MRVLSFVLIVLGLQALYGNVLSFREDTIDVIQEFKKIPKEERKDFLIEQTIELQPVDFRKDAILYLDCNQETKPKEHSGKYPFIKADVFLTKTQKETKIKNVCYFKNRNQTIELQTDPKFWPHQNTEAFTISFWFFPLLEFPYQTIFEWVSFANEGIKGFWIYHHNGEILLKIQSVLKKEVPFSFQKVITPKLSLRKWNHILISFSTEKNQILVFFNAKLQQLIELPKNAVWDFSSLDYPPIVIGKNLIGYLDDFLILKGFFTTPITYYDYQPLEWDLLSGRIQNPVSFLTSPWIQLRHNTSQVQFFVQYEKPQGTILKVEYRFSETPSENSNWTSFSLEKDKKTFSFRELRPYLQFRIFMRQDSKGTTTPKITEFKIITTTIESLPKVSSVKIIPELTNEHQVCIEWQKIPEEIIEEFGGYNLHIGTKKEHSEISISEVYRNGRWIPIKKQTLDFPLTKDEEELLKIRPTFIKQHMKNHIRIILTKDELYHYYEKKAREKNTLPLRYPIVFETDVVYYLRVSSYVYKPEIHSKLSQEVVFEF
ncbi:MAG: LamG domain-containing protein [Leptospiraceae bacterium]|nr:LamG domain-containing protein [Leptospiraceae bacterium]MDW7975293.1 hypothetical protein [Leptospiraceae bacterium]